MGLELANNTNKSSENKAESLNKLLMHDDVAAGIPNPIDKTLTKQQSLKGEIEFEEMQLEGAEIEQMEAKKLLAKRARHVVQPVEINFDIDAFMRAKKRFRPEFESTADVTGGNSPNQNEAEPETTLALAHQYLKDDRRRAFLKQNLINQYMEQVEEYDLFGTTQANH